MNWLPKPANFVSALENAARTDDEIEKLGLLVDIARHRLTFLETIQVDNLLASIGPIKRTALHPCIKVALLGSSTVRHLLPFLRVSAIRHGMYFDIFEGSYGQYRQELLVPSTSLLEFAPDVVVLSVNSGEVLANVAVADTNEHIDRIVATFVDDLRELWQSVRKTFDATVIQQSVLDATPSLFGSIDRLIPGAPSRVISHVNELLARATTDEQVLWLDVAARIARDGLSQWFDQARWLQGKMEIAPQAANEYGELVARLIAAQRGKSRKCLVLDLDNTLWGGVVGDDGIEGIVLGPGSVLGEAHLALQNYARTLNQGGILLAVCSKNDEATAKLAFDTHPEMLLKQADIAAFVANWKDKAENLMVIADRLNIGLDSLVFVDDNPVERARVRHSLPMVAVPELPDDPAKFVYCVAAAGYFESVVFTSADGQRARLYAENAERSRNRKQAVTIEDFLADLDMVVSYSPVDSVTIARVTQLINKTNQFNTTVRRLTSYEATGYSTDPENIMIQFRLTDRFGDNGLVSVLTMVPNPTEPDAIDIQNWVMSCRVFGRQLEDEIMNIAVESARDAGITVIYADYIPSDRNSVIRELFSTLGFLMYDNRSDDLVRWKLDVASYQTRNTHIRRRTI